MAGNETSIPRCENGGRFGLIKRLEDELEITERIEVLRRHVAMDTFHGVLPVLGLMVAGILAAHEQGASLVFQTTLLGGLGTSIALFVAGFFASYLTEKAEGRRLIRDCQNNNNKGLAYSVIVTAEHDTRILLAVVDGGVPSVSVLVSLAPMTLAILGIVDYVTSMYMGIAMGFIVLFGLGVYLSTISGASVWSAGLRTVSAGVITVFVLLLVSIITGASP